MGVHRAALYFLNAYNQIKWMVGFFSNLIKFFGFSFGGDANLLFVRFFSAWLGARSRLLLQLVQFSQSGLGSGVLACIACGALLGIQCTVFLRLLFFVFFRGEMDVER